LVVLASPPLVDGGAPGKHAIALIRGLRAHGVEVRTIAAGQYFAGSPPTDLDVEVVAVTDRRPKAFAERLQDAAREADVVHFEQVDTSALGKRISGASLVHVHHRVRLDQPLGPPWRNDFRWIVKRALIERSALRRHRFLLASSPVVEATLIADAPRAQVALAPLALDGDLYPRVPLDGPPTAGIIGTAHWVPTREAMTRLIERVWPRVRGRIPEARLLVAGRGTDTLPGGTGIEILGEVPSTVEFLRLLTLLVFPLSRGSGVKVKTLEAIASGLPVVTTSAGAEGIAASEGVVVEQRDDALAAAAAAVLLDRAEARRRSEAARATFNARHTPTLAAAPVVALYRRMLAG
jgi:glycosyltransferase involved in cell wall biosynthesis